MHSRLSLILFFALLGCGNNGTAVLVTVGASSTIPDIAKLHAHAIAGAQTRDFDVPIRTTTIPPAHSFGIDVPDSIQGMLSVHVEGFDSKGSSVGTGDGSTSLASGQREAISITLSNAAVDGGIDLTPIDLLPVDLATPDLRPPCGGPDQSCCSSGTACVAGTSCQSSVCAVSDLWVVGQDTTNIAAIKPVMMHFDGQSWTLGATLPGAKDNFAMWGSSPSNYWVVGNQGNAYHYDGSAWIQCVGGNICPSTNTGAALNGVFGFSPTDVWIASSTTTLHFDGFSFATRSSGLPASFSSGQLWGSSPTDLWNAAVTTAYHWDGAKWTGYAIGNGFGVWGTSANDVWIAGSQIQHWNGTAWSLPYTVDGGALPGTIDVLHGTGPSDIWGAGSDSMSNAVIVHWDGSKWSRVAGGGMSNLRGVWAASPTSAWIIGSSTSSPILKWNGSAWSSVILPAAATTNHFWSSIWGSAGGGK